jgi:hypothetical protein
MGTFGPAARGRADYMDDGTRFAAEFHHFARAIIGRLSLGWNNERACAL